MTPVEPRTAVGRLTAALPLMPDAERERVRLRLGTEFVTHRHDLWPDGSAPDADFIRANAHHILGMLEQALRHDGKDARRLPSRLHWVLWLLAEFDG